MNCVCAGVCLCMLVCACVALAYLHAHVWQLHGYMCMWCHSCMFTCLRVAPACLHVLVSHLHVCMHVCVWQLNVYMHGFWYPAVSNLSVVRVCMHFPMCSDGPRTPRLVACASWDWDQVDNDPVLD